MTVMTLIAVGLVGLALASTAPAEAADVYEPAAADLDRVAAMMAPAPGGFGPPAADRAAWSKAAARPEMREAVQRAEDTLGKPLPEMTDDLYLDYSRTGNRDRGQAVFFERRARVSSYALAECLEGKGRFPQPDQPFLEGQRDERNGLSTRTLLGRGVHELRTHRDPSPQRQDLQKHRSDAGNILHLPPPRLQCERVFRLLQRRDRQDVPVTGTT